MLGLKIAVTGALVFALTGSVMAVIGKKMPALWVALPILALFFGGLAAVGLYGLWCFYDGRA